MVKETSAERHARRAHAPEPDTSHALAFTLRIPSPFQGEAPIVVHAFDDAGWDSAGRVVLRVSVRQGGRTIFAANARREGACMVPTKGALYCALHGSSDGNRARELVLSLVAMRPGDTDRDYFAAYSPDQLAWAERYGEHLSAVREARYCDPETGEARDD